MGLFLQKGWALLDFSRSDLKRDTVKGLSFAGDPLSRSDPNRNARLLKGPTLTGGLANGQAGAAKLKGPTLTGFSPSSKLSPGLSNQPKTFIYLFWQSQCQIANLSPIL